MWHLRHNQALERTNAEPGRAQTRQLVLLYALFGASLLVMIGVAVLVMLRLPNLFLRYLAGFILLVALFFVWARSPRRFLPRPMLVGFFPSASAVRPMVPSFAV
jgi:hypothetical protein